MKIKTVGSICSGIEAASVAWNPLGFQIQWFSETADFPCRVLSQRHPGIPNLGDMMKLPELLKTEQIPAPDMICGGTPCQAFSFAGMKRGLNDQRGNLTLKFVDILKTCDKIRHQKGLMQSIAFWENVEGVLSDRTNAFGCFVSSLAGLSDVLTLPRWPAAGIIHGPQRNIAWRILDAKYFGVPQQRKRLYLLAGGKDFYPENVLFEIHQSSCLPYPEFPLLFEKDGQHFESFQSYTSCLCSSYGTKWNGNSGAYTGSLFIVQENRIRRFSPLECERLMGFPDQYTNIEKSTRTNRYQAIGNSWAVPVVRWIGNRLLTVNTNKTILNRQSGINNIVDLNGKGIFIPCRESIFHGLSGISFNCTPVPEQPIFSEIKSIISVDAPEEIYLSPAACAGILRRRKGLSLNRRLADILTKTVNQND